MRTFVNPAIKSPDAPKGGSTTLFAGGRDISAVPILPRLLVYDTPSVEQLLPLLERLFPSGRIEHCTELRSAGERDNNTLPVWHVSSTPQEVALSATALLRDLIYPLAISDSPFVVSFSFSKLELEPRRLTSETMSQLDVEDIRKLLAPDAAAEQTFNQLHLLATHTPMTPIEMQLAEALHRHGLAARPQVRFGRYVIDFMVEEGSRRLAIEADGRAFHDIARDAARDAELTTMGIDQVVRFSGSEIFRSADTCARKVKALLSGGPAIRNGHLRRFDLDESQRTAVQHVAGAARVLAPAGAGKTRVLVERIAELISDGVEPSSILALAFNKKANEQLLERLGELGVPTSPRFLFGDAEGVRCATFNAFGHRFQRERLNLRFSLETSPAVWRRLMAEAAALAGVTIKGTKRGTDPIGQLLDARARACADLTNLDELDVEVERFNGEPSLVIPYREIDREFEELRVGRELQSFDDQLATTVKALLHAPAERLFLQQYFDHVLVDEFQDLNAAQLALVEIVSRPRRNLFVVGDDDQLIYGWRFAKLTNILEFEERVPHASTYVLSTNHRSSTWIVDSSRRVIDRNRNRVPKDIRAREGAPNGDVRYVSEVSHEAQAAGLVTFVTEARERTEHWRDIAVLCRYKAQQPSVAMALDAAGIPRTPLLRYRLFSDRNMELLRAYLELVRDPGSATGEQLALVVNRPNRFATNRLLETLREASDPWGTFCRSLDGSRDDEDRYRLRTLVGFHERVESLHSRMSESLAPLGLINEIVDRLDLVRHWRDEQSNQHAPDDADPLELLDLIRLHAAEHRSVNSFLGHWDQRASEEQAGEGMDDDDLRREEAEDLDRVVIGTIHAAKGREYEAVVLFDYNPDLTQLTDSEVEEERRVFYVGMTRARDSLLMTVNANKPLHRFVRDSIAPAAPREQERIEEEQIALRPQEKEATVAVAQAEDRIAQLVDGREQTRLLVERDKALEHAEKLNASVTQLEDRLEQSGLWDKLSLRRARTRTELAVVRDEFARASVEAKATEDELTFFGADLRRYTEPLQATLAKARDHLAALDRARKVLESRVHELQLLSS